MNYKILYEETLAQLNKLKTNYKKLQKENELLKERTIKGSTPSINGNAYEKIIYDVVKNTHVTYIDNTIPDTNQGSLLSKKENKFIQIDESKLGGSSAGIDLKCIYNKKNIGIEAKKHNTPDWMQCSLKYNLKNKKWEGSATCKIPPECRNIFNDLIKDINIYDGDVPPFINNKITHDEWKEIKKSTDKWNDIYIPIPSDIIKKLYSLKGCQYIQISDYGLYHLGNDICNFNVPEFIIEQQLRIRTKIHSSKNKNGFCSISVIAACQPIDIKKLEKSSYSLDSIDMLPPNLLYKKITDL